MDRRTFIGGVAFGLVVVPLASLAQQVGKVYRVGMLETTPMAMNAANLGAFRQQLRELGYAEGRNLIIEYRSADGRSERFRAWRPRAAGQVRTDHQPEDREGTWHDSAAAVVTRGRRCSVISWTSDDYD